MNLFNSGNRSAVSGTALATSIAKHQLAIYGDALNTVNMGVAGWTNSGKLVSYSSHNLVVFDSNTSAAVHRAGDCFGLLCAVKHR